MNPVEDFILDYPHESTKQLMQLTHQLLLDCIPHLQYDIKWKVPFYTYKKSFCYMNPKTNLLILGLMGGASISDPDCLLEGTQKLLRHYIIKTADDIFKEGFHRLLMEAIIINEQKRIK